MLSLDAELGGLPLHDLVAADVDLLSHTTNGAALVGELSAWPVLPVQVPEASAVGVCEGLQLPYVPLLLLGADALQDDCEDLFRQVAVEAGVAGQGHEDSLGRLQHLVHLLLPHAVDWRGQGTWSPAGVLRAAAVARACWTVRSAMWASLSVIASTA
ncbi:hypothetical protein ABZY05_33655 [Streptomyces canus]|uniref:hypothetical protein n=1 Tax=Streptomyces canus TaxID=58343 RepID=UPI0033A35402